MPMMRFSLAVALAFSTAAALAGPVITSITPSSAPVAGGTEVTIKGSGFNDPCAPPKACPVRALNVYFGNDLAASSTLIDAQTIVAVTAPHLPGLVKVLVCQTDGCASLDQAFTFEGDPDQGFARLLMPIFLAPTEGAFGSKFVTLAELWNKFDTFDIPVYGVGPPCPGILCPAPDLSFPVALAHSSPMILQPSGGSPGRILFVPKNSADSVAANLRVMDVSRTTQTAGTEIPVVRDADFSSDAIALLGIPWDVNYRNTLRIYSAYPDAPAVWLTFGNDPQTTQMIVLRPGATIFDPACAVFTDFPTPPVTANPAGAIGTLTLKIELAPDIPGAPPGRRGIWAFVSSTNNTTQQITVVSPQ